MATPAGITTAYHGRLEALRAGVDARLRDMYDRTISPDDLDAAFERFIAEAATLVAGGQSAASTLAAAYLRALLTAEGVEQPAVIDTAPHVGMNRDGRPLAAAFGALPAMVKLAIGQGRPLPDALALGSHLARRTADSEVVRVADDVTQRAAEDHPRVIGWTGVVSATSCEPCGANRGQHALSDALYRHPGCGCVKQWVTA
jgi:hypothetical protein